MPRCVSWLLAIGWTLAMPGMSAALTAGHRPLVYNLPQTGQGRKGKGLGARG